MLGFLRKLVQIDKTEKGGGASSVPKSNVYGYTGGPVFGPWDTSVHAAPGQYARFGRAVARPFAVFSKSENRTRVLDCDAKTGAIKVKGRKDRVYTVTLESCTCPDFQERSLPCKHIYGLALYLGYTAHDYWSSWLDVVCSDGVIPRPASGYSNGVYKYDVRGINPETGRKNKRTVVAFGECDAVAAAQETGLTEPFEVLPLDMEAQNTRPVSKEQIELAEEYQIAFAPDFDEKDAAAILSRYDRNDGTGIPIGLLQFLSERRVKVSLLSSAYDLIWLAFSKLAQRDILALYAAAVQLHRRGLGLSESGANPVNASCYAFADANDGASWLDELTTRDLLAPAKNSPAYRAAASFMSTHEE